MSSHQALLSKLQKKKLLVKARNTGMQKGSRQSKRIGSSLEFSDYRIYQPGDDIRQIDWNVYGRTQKHYIKRFLDERELSISIYLDGSSSMRKSPAKWELAKLIAASLSYIVLNNEDRLHFFSVSSSGVYPVKRKGSVYGKRTFMEIINLNQEAKTGEFMKSLSGAIRKGAQLSIIVTDGLERLEEIESLFKKIAAFRREIWLIQVLSEDELSPSYSGDVKLVDSETDTAVNVSMNPKLIADYKFRLTEHNRKLKDICRKVGGQYLLVSDARDVQSIIFHDFPKHRLTN
jgi:uncharacterized protein (DUF58 family)